MRLNYIEEVRINYVMNNVCCFSTFTVNWLDSKCFSFEIKKCNDDKVTAESNHLSQSLFLRKKFQAKANRQKTDVISICYHEMAGEDLCWEVKPGTSWCKQSYIKLFLKRTSFTYNVKTKMGTFFSMNVYFRFSEPLLFFKQIM